VLAVFLTLGVVRGDAESGLLQPIVVRPIGRTTMLLARFAGAALLSAAYVVVVYLAAYAITEATGSWSPDHLLGPALALALGVAIIAALSLLASTVLSVTAQGIVVFMVFGAGLTAGLLAQIGHAIDSHSLHTIGRVASWALPFEGLYTAGLHALISGTSGLTGVVLQLGPFGGSEAAGPGLILWAFVYLLGVLALAAFIFSRRDL
jgi:ABC-type transport system involved in multi-copper enzyme maturation permease subunit